MELKRKGEKGRRDLSGDEPRGVSEEAALLPAGGLALEHRLPSEEGRDQQWPLNGGSGAETAAASSSFPCLVFFHPSLSRLGIISALFAAIISCPAPLTSACPPIPFPLPRRTAFSQMVNLNGLLVKSASTDGFHLQTGLPDPPLQFLPPPFPPLLSSPHLPHCPVLPSGFAREDCEPVRGLLRDVQETRCSCSTNQNTEMVSNQQLFVGLVENIEATEKTK